MRFFKFYISFFLLLMLSVNGNAQVLPAIEKAFANYSDNTFKEKIYVQSDNDFYLTGEILWFKVYCVNAQNNKPAKVSKLAYLEILDEKNNPVLQTKIALKEGIGNGSIFIPVNLSNGNYKMRSYTNWMKNFGAETFFEKKITIVNTLNTPQAVKAEEKKYDFQFFPEGGDLVEGIQSKVGFKILGLDGKGLDVSGVIVSSKGDTAARFQSLKFGIGTFNLTPAPNTIYKAVAKSGSKDIIFQELPVAKKNGFVLKIVESNNNLTSTVSASLGEGRVYVIAHDGSKILYSETGTLSVGKANFSFNTSKLKEGTNYITVFDGEGKAVAERLYFKKPEKRLSIVTTTDLNSYTSRQAVNVDVSTGINEKLNETASASVSVYRIDSLDVKNEINIENYFMLFSNLKGNVESPGFYFQSNDTNTKEALDNLMVTQGWRRFDWEKILSNTTPNFKYLPEYNGHLISGKINDKNGKPVKNVFTYMGVPGKRIQFYGASSDSTGHFLFNTRDFYGQNEIVLQPNYELDSTLQVSLNNPFFESYLPFKYGTLNVGANQLRDLNTRSLNMQVQNIYAGNKLRQFYTPDIDSSSFYLKPYKTYNLNDYTRFTTMEEVLREYVAQVFVYKKQKRFHFHILGEEAMLDQEIDPLVLLDGVPYFNLDRVINIDPLKIEKLEVFRERYYFGPLSIEGILSFKTPKGDLGGNEIDPHAVVLDYEGMQLQREFYAPKYDSAQLKASRTPDFRNTLYWSPEINFDKNGKGKISFYTSDQTGLYIGVIQGISNLGLPGSGTFSFEVKK